MKLTKLLLAVMGTTVLLGALVSTSSAGRLRFSDNDIRAIFPTMDFTGALFGRVECEVTLEGTFHSLSIRKTNLSLIGLITSAELIRACRRGGATILRETLPWHIKYRAFTGTLPNMLSIRGNFVGAGFRIREPSFGTQCLATSPAEAPVEGIFSRNTGTGELTSLSVNSTIPCGGDVLNLGNISSTLENGARARVTLTLI